MALNKLPLTEILGLALFWYRTFWHGLFGTRTFQQENISAWVYFSTTDILAQGFYGARTGKFWHKAHGYFSTDILARLPLCQNVHVPKYSSAKMFQCRNDHVPKCPWCKKILMPKCSCAKMSLCQKVPVVKCPCWNVSSQNVRCPNKPKPNIESNLMILNNVEIACFNYTAWPLLHFG